MSLQYDVLYHSMNILCAIMGHKAQKESGFISDALVGCHVKRNDFDLGEADVHYSCCKRCGEVLDAHLLTGGEIIRWEEGDRVALVMSDGNEYLVHGAP